MQFLNITGKVIGIKPNSLWFYSKWVSVAHITSKGKVYTFIFNDDDNDTFIMLNNAQNYNRDIDIQGILRVCADGNEVYEIVKERE